MTDTVQIGVAGALGHMGRAVIELVRGRNDLVLGPLLDRPSADADVTLSTREEALAASDVIIDFSVAAASVELARLAAVQGGPALVIGATGFTDDENAAIIEAARTVPIVKSGNFSIGLNVLAGLVGQAARRLDADDWDIEIVETHHRRKRDAPSGTALMLGEAAARARGADLSQVAVRGRDGIGEPRRRGDIGFASLRGGGVVGEHNVVFAADDEIITFTHSARDRRLFARGAVAAAQWIRGRPAGLYDMADVLGFKE